MDQVLKIPSKGGLEIRSVHMLEFALPGNAPSRQVILDSHVKANIVERRDFDRNGVYFYFDKDKNEVKIKMGIVEGTAQYGDLLYLSGSNA